MPFLKILYENRVCSITDTHLLPKIFTLHILPFASQDYFLPRMSFALKNASKIFLVPQSPPPPIRICSTKTYSQTFHPKKICFKKNWIPILLTKVSSIEFVPQMFPSKFAPKHLVPKFLLFLLIQKKNVPIFCSKTCLLPQTLC